jgi:diadenylate cyclase
VNGTGAMDRFFNGIKTAILQMQLRDIIDIVILAAIIYQLIKIARESRAMQLLIGFGIIIIAAQLSQWLRLTGVSWLLSSILNGGILVLIVLFAPEIRRALERLGSGRLPDNSLLPIAAEPIAGSPAEELARAVLNLAKKRTGALIALQRANTLSHIVESGTYLDARLTSQLVENIFVTNSPLHDGAMIVSGSRIVAAGCFLPLASNVQLGPELGTRHRAAIGMTETTDALVIIVSEETGIISVAEAGRLSRFIDASGLRQEIAKVYGRRESSRMFNGLLRRRKHDGKKGT